MKKGFWYGVRVLLVAGLYPTGPVHAQSLTGVWQGVETDTGAKGRYWPTVLRLQKNGGDNLFGVLYQEVGLQPGISVTFEMQGASLATGMRLEHVRKLNETGRTPNSYWCNGAITFTYDAGQEKLTGRATYRPVADCDMGTFTFYRIKLKSAATVPAGAESTLRVSGRNVLWFADTDLKQPVVTGNSFRTKLTKTTTFYLKQSYYPTSQSPVVPITIQVRGTAATAKPAHATPAPVRPDTVPKAPAVIIAPTAVVLPTVLFRLGTPELLPDGLPILDQLATELKARPTLKVRVAGHTDKLGEPEKNQALSEQRAESVKAYLVKAGIAAERISIIGYGDARPLYPSPDARNRRVEVEEAK